MRNKFVGIHTIELHSGVSAEEFEKFMNEKVLPTAAETPGSVNRGGVSTIESQHILHNSGRSSDYLWLVKSSGAFDVDLFDRVFERMYEDAHEQLDRFGIRKSATLFSVVSGYDPGPRDQMGRPTGEPKVGPFL